MRYFLPSNPTPLLIQDLEDETKERTLSIGVGALTGLPFGLTGARVPAASAFLCSRWICGVEGLYDQ